MAEPSNSSFSMGRETFALLTAVYYNRLEQPVRLISGWDSQKGNILKQMCKFPESHGNC